MLITIYLLLVFVLPLGLSLVVSIRSLPLGPECPHCRDETIPLLSPLLQYASRLGHRPFQKRWCIGCGWEGIVRAPRESSTRDERALARAVHARPVARTLDIRNLTIDGEHWRVLLQCWSEAGHCQGRLVFVAPSGRLVPDPMQAFTGDSPDEVVGQVLSMPERALASRLREVASE